MTRQCLRRAIEANPLFKVCWEADNGLEALLLAKKSQPDVVLLDAQLPRMDGFEVTSCLRQCRRNTCIVVMSVFEEGRARALATGADAFVVKDCGRDKILEALSRLLAGRLHQQVGDVETVS
jgi:DNA-binding NarL/FixJ family response regulator